MKLEIAPEDTDLLARLLESDITKFYELIVHAVRVGTDQYADSGNSGFQHAMILADQLRKRQDLLEKLRDAMSRMP